jgi:dimethylamine monooxygenase subunit A
MLHNVSSSAHAQLTTDELWSFAPDERYYTTPEPPSWLDELDFRIAPPHVKMGTHALGPDEWLLADAARDHELAIRNRLLDERHTDVFAALPSADEAAEEVLELVTAWSLKKGFGEPLTGEQRSHPLETAGRHTQEDLCLMIRRDGAWHLDAAVLCFPTFWSLAEKLGKPNAEVHGPVPHYADEISERVDRFFDRLRVDAPVWRRNFSVKPFSLLFVPVVRSSQPVGDLRTRPDGRPFWLRSERQTLQRLPQTGAILFTIRVQLAPAAVFLRRPDRARDLAAMYRSWDPAMRQFKIGGNDLIPSFVPWLEQVAAGELPG